jgi:hypothetical protein
MVHALRSIHPNHQHTERSSTAKATINTQANAQITKAMKSSNKNINRTINSSASTAIIITSSPTLAYPIKQPTKPPRCTSTKYIGEVDKKREVPKRAKMDP